MRKTLLLLVCFCLLAAPAAFAQFRTANLGAFDMVLADDFHNGFNYMNKFTPDNLFNGYQIKKGDVFELKMTFTSSRDLEEKTQDGKDNNRQLQIGLCSFAPPSHWFQISWDDSQKVSLGKVENVRAGQTYSVTLTLTAIRDAPGPAALQNGIVFLTDGTGRRRNNGGAMGPVTLKFTEFVLTKK